MAKESAAVNIAEAAFWKKVDVVKAELAKGVHVDTQDGDGRTALHYAAMRDQPALFELLVKRGARVDIPDGYEKLPIHFAAEQGVEKLLARLIELGPTLINKRERLGLTPLHEAVDHKHDRCVELLLAAGADTTIKDAFKRTPVEYATKARIKKLFETGAGTPHAKPKAKPTAKPKPAVADPTPPAAPAINGVAAPLASIDAWKKCSGAKRSALANALCKALGTGWSPAKQTSGAYELLVLEYAGAPFVVVPGGGAVLGLRASDLRVLPKLDLDDELEDNIRGSVAPVATTIAPPLCAQTPLLGQHIRALSITADAKVDDNRVAMFSRKRIGAASKAAAKAKLRAPTHQEWEWIARSLGVDPFIGASSIDRVEAACDVLTDMELTRTTARVAAKATGIWGLQIGEWISPKPGAAPTLATADIAQTYPWQNEHEVAAAFAGMPPKKPAASVALRLVRSLPKL